MNELIRQKFGVGDIDPLTGVPPENLEEARRTVELWSDARRSDLRQLVRAVRKEPLPAWKQSVLAKVLARDALRLTGRRRQTVLLALAAVDQDFDALAQL